MLFGRHVLTFTPSFRRYQIRFITMRTKQIAAAVFVALYAVNGSPSFSPHDLALRMLTSIEERGQATVDAGGSTGFIQLALFWQALAVVLDAPDSEHKANDSNDVAAAAALRPLLNTSLASTIPAFANVSKDVELPLDRLSLGADMIAWSLRQECDNTATTFLPTILNLNDSLSLQPQNTNGGLWYYNNVNNLTAYRNLSYLDGMYSYAPYVTILPQLKDSASNPVAALESAVEQLHILHDICAKPSGLLVHGYDALRAHTWAASNSNGASPEVWGRALAWYSLSLLNTLEIAAHNPEQLWSEAYGSLLALFQSVMRAQIEAAERGKSQTGVPGVWQVVDRAGEAGNFVEASSSFMSVYTLLRGERLGYLRSDGNATVVGNADQNCTGSGIVELATEMYETVLEQYLITHANGSLSLNGTSSVASLSPQEVGYEYYVSRPREMDSLIGTSAFALASYEMGRL